MIDAYLARIGYDGPREPSPETLRALHERHLFTVPFENLDIHFGRAVVATEENVVEKVVTRRRGGFCYELNGAFAALLRALGYEVDLLSGRVARAAGGYGPEFDHMALLVHAGGRRWLADVGFGECFTQPLDLDDRAPQHDRAGTYGVEPRGGRDWAMRVLRDGQWADEYLFSLEPHVMADYADRCRFHQTSPESSFTQKRVCTLATETGRITLRDDRLIVTEHGTKREEPIADEQAWRAALRTRFGIDL
jgi:N-hydroxyarylamine O-acetyltransferase